MKLLNFFRNPYIMVRIKGKRLTLILLLALKVKMHCLNIRKYLERFFAYNNNIITGFVG